MASCHDKNVFFAFLKVVRTNKNSHHYFNFTIMKLKKFLLTVWFHKSWLIMLLRFATIFIFVEFFGFSRHVEQYIFSECAGCFIFSRLSRGFLAQVDKTQNSRYRSVNLWTLLSFLLIYLPRKGFADNFDTICLADCKSSKYCDTSVVYTEESIVLEENQ